MAKTYPDGFSKGMFVVTTPIFDLTDLEEAGIASEKFQELMNQTHDRLLEINKTINFKTTGVHAEDEFVNGNVFYKPAATTSTQTTSRILAQSFIKIVYFGALPADATPKTVAHGIDFTGADFMFTKIFGVATDPTTPLSINIPYVNVSGTIATDIELYVDGTNIVITGNGLDLSAFTNVLVTLEYVKY